MGKMDDSQYLQSLLHQKNMEISEIEVQRRIAIAEFNAKLSVLNQDIISIEKQLNAMH